MRRIATLAALLLLAAAAAARAADLPDRLAGTWHVLVHYKDANATHPDEERWDDRVWVFEKKGDRLRWTEYPIAVFADESGRFERRATGQLARVLGYWEPSEAQLAEIEAGLELNSRGMKSKTLRNSRGVWSSSSRPTSASASIVSYTESWSIEGTPGAAGVPPRGLAGGRAYRIAGWGDALHHHQASTRPATCWRGASSATAPAAALPHDARRRRAGPHHASGRRSSGPRTPSSRR